MCDGQRRCAKMLRKQPAKMATGYAKPLGKILYGRIIESTIRNQPETSPDCCRRSAPCWSSRCAFGAAPQTGPKTCLAGCRRTRIESDVLRFRRHGRANWPTVNACCFDAYKKLAIKPGITGQSRPFIDIVLLHAGSIRRGPAQTSQNRTSTNDRCHPCTGT